MACRMEEPWQTTERLGEEAAFLRAALCATLRAAESIIADYVKDGAGIDVLLQRIDERASGVSRTELLKWWQEHQREDEERRAREQAAQEQERQRTELIYSARRKLAALTQAEREALGIRANPL